MQSSLSIRTISLIISGESPSRHRTPNNRGSPPRYFSQLNPSGNHSSSACETELLREKCVRVLSQKSPSRLPYFRECPGWKGHAPSPPFEADSASGIGRQARGDPSTEPQIAAQAEGVPLYGQKQQPDLRTPTSHDPAQPPLKARGRGASRGSCFRQTLQPAARMLPSLCRAPRSSPTRPRANASVFYRSAKAMRATCPSAAAGAPSSICGDDAQLAPPWFAT
jgi:hypothetical protein